MSGSGARPPFPEIEPYASGLLDVGEGDRVYWETSGNPDGRPVLVVHGGPGGGGRRGARKTFDPTVFRIVMFDQRGCGESLPHASDPGVDLAHNTTEHLLADMERLREHLGIERWVLYGGSWGCTLILAYAQRHPDRVIGIVLVGVFMTRPQEIDWLYHGLRLLLPIEWERFRSGAPAEYRDGNLVEGYRQLMEQPDPAVREQAAHDWCTWEDAAIAHETLGAPGQYSAKPDAALLAFVRICTHYFAHGAWLEDDQLLREAHRLAGIPGVLIHGRLDLSAPSLTAWELARAWPDAELKIIEDSGHTGSPAMVGAIYDAVARFAG
ncbi:prolyl aminopeptidase [Nocardia jejuensis]|uniref:prolyl aminopeptidase n=1 Tax=Nocardia jejuensis TaxID=328049 RepID=UPI00082FE456|nr:prolyl aminopeptidase [Nocardia jejuensis]